MKTLFQENREAILFIVKFVGLYLVLNTLYGFYVEYYYPQPDPVTLVVTRQVAAILSVFHPVVEAIPDSTSSYVILQHNSQIVVSVFEGCNSLNVMIVYISFLIAFKGSLSSTLQFSFLGLVLVYVMNQLRVGLLFEVALKFPQHLYFFHKYFFTGIIYGVVFVVWFFWVKRVRGERVD
jgi:exosortase family protein XrtF